uniref:Uncharacterized protein n=1 Tax=Arundo donax TaxID=35708 RepID=A0A0A8YKD4_ARUDO
MHRKFEFWRIKNCVLDSSTTQM